MQHDSFNPALPLRLQFFAEGDPAPTPPAPKPNPNPDGEGGKPTTPQPPKPAAQTNPEDFATALLAAVESATAKKERNIVRSMAEQYGLTDEEAQKALDAAKTEKAKQLPPEVQQQLDQITQAANNKLITAEVKTIGTAMGLLDADAALALMDKSSVKVDQNGVVSGAKEALEALKTAKPYLFKADEAKPTGEKKDVGGKVGEGGAPTVTKEQFERMGVGERTKLKRENPALYSSLIGR